MKLLKFGVVLVLVIVVAIVALASVRNIENDSFNDEIVLKVV